MYSNIVVYYNSNDMIYMMIMVVIIYKKKEEKRQGFSKVKKKPDVCLEKNATLFKKVR